MKLSTWFGLDNTETKPTINYQDRCAYAIGEVKDLLETKQYILQDGAKTTRELTELIHRLSCSLGADHWIVHGLQDQLAQAQHQTECDLQDTEYRLAIYRNIVLMQGRI